MSGRRMDEMAVDTDFGSDVEPFGCCGAAGCPMDAVTAQAQAMNARNRELHRALAETEAERGEAVAGRVAAEAEVARLRILLQVGGEDLLTQARARRPP